MFFQTAAGLHEFRLGVDYLVESGQHSIFIDDNGQPFRVTQDQRAQSRFEMPWYDNVYHFVSAKS